MSKKLQEAVGSAFPRPEKVETHVAPSLRSDLQNMRATQEEAQTNCELNMLALVALNNFCDEFGRDVKIEYTDPLVRKYLNALVTYIERNEVGLVAQVDMPDEYGSLVQSNLEDQSHLIYVVNAIYQSWGLPKNGGVMPGEEVPFISILPKDMDPQYRDIQAAVINEANEVVEKLNAGLIAWIRDEYGYPQSDDTYRAAFVYMMEVHPEILVYGDAADWLPAVFDLVNLGQSVEHDSVPAHSSLTQNDLLH